jgi:hypothetical protein
MTHSAQATLRPVTEYDAPLFYSVIDQTMRAYIMATWGAWDEARVVREASECSRNPDAQVILVDQVEAAASRQDSVELRVLRVNPAREFYEKLGFVITKQDNDFLSMHKNHHTLA